MSSALLEKKREVLHRKADLFIEKLQVTSKTDASELLHGILDLIIEENAELRESKSDRSEIRELIQEMRHGFATMEKRFEALQAQMDKRFEAIDNRFEAMQVQLDKRFEAMQVQMDRRFEAMQLQMDKRFEAVERRFDDVNKRFDDVNKRFDDVNRRFDDANKRFDDFNKRFSQTQWLIGFGFSLLTILIAVLKIFGK